MILCRRILLILAIALAPLQLVPMQLAQAGQMAVEPGPAVMTIHETATMTDCCMDGTHRGPTCQFFTALPPAEPSLSPGTQSRDTHPHPPATRAQGRKDSPDLRPPIPV